MTLTVLLPELIGRHLEREWGNESLSRRIVEALALEGYRTEVLSAGQVAELLGISVLETERFLKVRGAILPYTLEDLDEDRAAHEKLFAQSE